MNRHELGRLERVDLREIWGSEAGEFTPWLAREINLKLLGDTIGLDLSLEATEKSVGPFRADIVCKDTTDNSYVLIENQLERTDHTHLGQLLTYAAGLSTVTIVWVAERFTDEHRAALDWLNEVTENGINFFGLEIELWRIGSSPVAPKFNVVSQPNDWVKTISTVRDSDALSDIKRRQLEYWTRFREFLVTRRSLVKAQKPQPQHWLVFAVGRSNFHISALAGMRDKFIGVELVISDENAKYHFRALERQRAAIEAEIGETLSWRELPNRKMSSVILVNRSVDPNDSTSWESQHIWLQEKIEAFYKAFSRRIRNLVPEDVDPESESVTGDIQ